MNNSAPKTSYQLQPKPQKFNELAVPLSYERRLALLTEIKAEQQKSVPYPSEVMELMKVFNYQEPQVKSLKPIKEFD